MARPLSRAALLLLAPLLLAAELEPAPAKVGLRIAPLPDSVVVTEVIPGMGADQAGLRVGDVLLTVDGVAVGGDEALARQKLMGPSQTAVAVTLRGPLDGPERARSLTRGLPAAPVKARALPPVVRDFRSAALGSNKRVATAAAEALVAANFGGLEPAQAVENTLRTALTRNPAVALAAAEPLRKTARRDPALAALIGEVDYRRGELAAAHETWAPLREGRRPDVEGAGLQVDLGGDFELRRLAALTAWKQGDRKQATALARTLAPFGPLGELQSTVGLALPEPAAPWLAPLPPAPALQLTLTDGQPWRLSDQAGEVTLLTFWATWCGPCQKELPEIAALRAALPTDQLNIVGVSIDDASTAAKIEPTVARLGVNFPVAHAPQAGAAFGVSSIPAMRVIGRDGAVVYAAKGYSPASVARLTEAVKAALAAPPGAGSAYGTPGGSAAARLLRFVPLPVASGLYADADRVVVGVPGASPLILDAKGAVQSEPDVSSGQGAPGERLAWLDGPVAIDRDDPWVRAWSAEGEDRWLRTLPARPVDLVAADGLLWLALPDSLLLLSAEGRLLHEAPLALTALAADPAGGVWAATGEDRRRLRFVGGAVTTEDIQPAPGARQVGPQGQIGRAGVSQLILGRFGPGGALRLIALREGKQVVGLSGEGAPAFTLSLSEPARLAAHDEDGDGQDELLIVTRGQGLATLALALP